MLIEGKFVVKGACQQVWDTVLEPGTLASCIPGTEKMVAVDAKTYETIVKQKVGPISVRLKFTTVLAETDPPRYVKAIGRGGDEGKMGTFTQETIVRLNEIKKGETEISYTSNVSMVGKLATFGDRIMRAKVKSIGEEFTQNLQKKIESKSKP
jgi:carbon monoxide dehydrogenase subunit G